MERKGQYTGWVERAVILGWLDPWKLQDIKKYTNPKDP